MSFEKTSLPWEYLRIPEQTFEKAPDTFRGFLMTAEDARAAGDEHFWTGGECHRGHNAPRETATGICMECKLEKANG